MPTNWAFYCPSKQMEVCACRGEPRLAVRDGNCLEEVFGMAGLASLRTTDLFPCKSVPEGLWYGGFLCPQTSCDWHSPGQGLEVTTQYLPVSWHADTEDSLFTVSKRWLN